MDQDPAVENGEFVETGRVFLADKQLEADVSLPSCGANSPAGW